jgi:hypothetical protein
MKDEGYYGCHGNWMKSVGWIMIRRRLPEAEMTFQLP